MSAESRSSTAAGSLNAALRTTAEAAWGKSLRRGTAAPLSSPSSLRVCPPFNPVHITLDRGGAHHPARRGLAPGGREGECVGWMEGG